MAFSIYLHKGSTGLNVKKVQQHLGISVDGVYGNETYEAVRDYQQRKGLTVHGNVGIETWQSMFGNASTTNPIAPTAGSNQGIIPMAIGGFLLYGLFKVIMKIF